MVNSITEEDYIKNMTSSLIDYTKSGVGTTITINNVTYNLTYDYNFPKYTKDFENLLPIIIFDHIGTDQDTDFGLGNTKKYMSTIRIYGFCGGTKPNDERHDEEMRVKLMSLIMKNLSDKYAIPFKEGAVVKGRMETKASIKKLEATSLSVVDRHRWVADVFVKMAYKR